MDDVYKSIINVIEGRATPGEKRRCDQWLSESARNRDEYEALAQLYRFAEENRSGVKDPGFYAGLEKIKARASGTKNKLPILLAVVFAIGISIYIFPTLEEPESLQFNDMPLAQIIATVESTYDVEITLADSSLADRKISAIFYERSIEDVLNGLASQLNCNWQRNADESYTICQP